VKQFSQANCQAIHSSTEILYHKILKIKKWGSTGNYLLPPGESQNLSLDIFYTILFKTCNLQPAFNPVYWAGIIEMVKNLSKTKSKNDFGPEGHFDQNP
jgi:hypothetical protein